MYTTLRDVLAVEVSKFFDEVKIVEQQRASWASGARILVIGDRSAACGRKRFDLAHAQFSSGRTWNCRLIGLRGVLIINMTPTNS
jgi:hypothetical protein